MTSTGEFQAEHEDEVRLRTILSGMGSVLVTLSGGVDSALVARVAASELGDRAVALTGHSESLPPGEAEAAAQLAAETGIHHVVVRTRELDRQEYRANNGNRCFHCKDELFGTAERVRAELGLAFVADGTMVDDLRDDRPGLVAAAQHHVRHPLVEAGLDKAAVRRLAKRLGVSVWAKPSLACLGSRFPKGIAIDAGKLDRVRRAEAGLLRLEFASLRVRWHEIGDRLLARIEVAPSEIERVARERDAVVRACRDAGFDHVTLDLCGYPSREPGTT